MRTMHFLTYGVQASDDLLYTYVVRGMYTQSMVLGVVCRLQWPGCVFFYVGIVISLQPFDKVWAVIEELFPHSLLLPSCSSLFLSFCVGIVQYSTCYAPPAHRNMKNPSIKKLKKLCLHTQALYDFPFHSLFCDRKPIMEGSLFHQVIMVMTDVSRESTRQ